MKIFYFFFLLLVTGLSAAQEQYLDEINASWKAYTDAFIEKDFHKVATLSHPKVVEKSGGMTYFINDLLQDAGMFSSAGLEIIALRPKRASQVITAGAELHAMLPYERVFLSGDEEIIENHFALAASQDDGQTWYFFDLSKQDAESIKIYLPYYDDRLNVYLDRE